MDPLKGNTGYKCPDNGRQPDYFGKHGIEEGHHHRKDEDEFRVFCNKRGSVQALKIPADYKQSECTCYNNKCNCLDRNKKDATSRERSGDDI
jgi:hypothetical protein